jgi:hypothetical protein
MFKRQRFFPNTSVSLQTSAAEARRAERQPLLGMQTLSKEKTLMYRAATRRLTVSKTEGQNLEPR